MIHDQPTEEHYEEFIDRDTEMDVLNKAIEITGESPIKKQRLKSSAYTFSKKSKIQETVSLTLFNLNFRSEMSTQSLTDRRSGRKIWIWEVWRPSTDYRR